MKIICDTTFLDGSTRFEAGDVRTVDDSRGAYFVANKWAHEVGHDVAALKSGTVTLDVQHSAHAQEARNG